MHNLPPSRGKSSSFSVRSSRILNFFFFLPRVYCVVCFGALKANLDVGAGVSRTSALAFCFDGWAGSTFGAFFFFSP
uniref:Uncharacterized protein n=1 Tax=Ixodes scapularis TaxID=6945 RepID=A0A4D5RAF2_IXOSC